MRRLPALSALMLVAAAPAPTTRARLEALNAREAELSARMEANRSQLVRLLSALESVRRDPPPALLVRPDRARDAARAAILLQAVTPELQRRARTFAGEARELKRIRREAAEAGAVLFAQESAAADTRLGGQSALRPGDLAPPPAPSAEAGEPPTRLSAPVSGAPVVRFGETRAGRARSQGWSWGVAAGAPVVAPAAGVVEYAGPLKSWKLVVVLRLDGGWRVVVAGLGRVLAPIGATVRAGERLGEAAAGPAPEVHLELRRGVETIDPGPLMSPRPNA